MKPLYTQDCSACRFIGSMDNGRLVDCYVCTGIDHSVIMRRSSEPSDYWSMPVSMVENTIYDYSSYQGNRIINGEIILARHILPLFRNPE